MNEPLRGYRNGITACALVLLLCASSAQAADSGVRHHAEGQYDAASAVYVVSVGDDLDAIAERFGVSVTELKAHNKLASNEIEVGQKLVVATGTPGSTAAIQYKMTTPIAPGVATPDTLETSIGTLHLRDGVPKPDTIEKIYDNLDRSRALQSYLLAIPMVNQASMRDSLRQFGPDNQTDVIWEQLVDSKTVELTANDNTIYN
ncbi:MAG: LysM peptidoglycan-binding domain-containing protein, partial [Candidatus Competibacter sp.]